MRTGRLSSMLLDSCTLLVEGVVLGTSEAVLGGRMALWQAGRGSLGEALGGAHKGTLRKHFREELSWSWSWWRRDSGSSDERQTTRSSSKLTICLNARDSGWKNFNPFNLLQSRHIPKPKRFLLYPHILAKSQVRQM